MNAITPTVRRWIRARLYCRRGMHAPLDWALIATRPVPRNSLADRRMCDAYRDGVRRIMWAGWCPDCGEAIDWREHKPFSPETCTVAIHADDAKWFELKYAREIAERIAARSPVVLVPGSPKAVRGLAMGLDTGGMYVEAFHLHSPL